MNNTQTPTTHNSDSDSEKEFNIFDKVEFLTVGRDRKFRHSEDLKKKVIKELKKDDDLKEMIEKKEQLEKDEESETEEEESDSDSDEEEHKETLKHSKKLLELQRLLKKITRENLTLEQRKTEGKSEFYPRIYKEALFIIEDYEEFKKGIERLLKCIIKHFIKLIKNLEIKERNEKTENKKFELVAFLRAKFNKLYKKFRADGFFYININYNEFKF